MPTPFYTVAPLQFVDIETRFVYSVPLRPRKFVDGNEVKIEKESRIVGLNMFRQGPLTQNRAHPNRS